MRVTHITIDKYRSIEHVEITFPLGKPLILFGPNNAGKSNIISAINRILGERFAPYVEMSDSDFYMRDKQRYPESKITCEFDSAYHTSNRGESVSRISVSYNKDSSVNSYVNDFGTKIFVKNEERKAIQSFLVDAERSINYQLSYSSRYTLLSKFSHAVHEALTGDQKDQLNDAFMKIKDVFQAVPEYADFASDFVSAVSDSVQGFVHKLEVDFSAYDPNNYANAMRVFAKEGDETRSFDEFGTGEQQVLLMAFAKAYMEAFGSESIVLILEEPEAHLHPLAQAWLKEYIYDLCESGLQIVLSTHSPDFIDAGNLQGLVRVYKESDGVTRTVQLTQLQLVDQCVSMGVPADKITDIGVSDFYKAKLTTGMLRGFFAKTILLVEGRTERVALPIYFERAGFSLPANGVEIVDCGGKGNIPSLYRLFKSYGLDCYSLFDADESDCDNIELKSLLDIPFITPESTQFIAEENYAYFSKDFETTVRAEIEDYLKFEEEARNLYKAKGKPAVARIAASICNEIPNFIISLIAQLRFSSSDLEVQAVETDEVIYEPWINEEYSDDVPF